MARIDQGKSTARKKTVQRRRRAVNRAPSGSRGSGAAPRGAGTGRVSRPSPAPTTRPTVTNVRQPRYRVQAPKAQPGPYRGTERRKVERHKKTPTYRASIRSSYAAQPVAARKARVKRAASRLDAGKASREDRIVLRMHARRSKRDKDNFSLQQFTDRQRRIVDAFKRTESFAVARREARKAGEDRGERSRGTKTDKLVTAGLGSLPGLLPGVTGKALRAGGELVRATAEDPGQVASSSARTAKESITGIPQSLKQLYDDPTGEPGRVVEEYKQRYGPVFEGDWSKFREQVKKDYGLTPFAMDLAAVGAPVGRVAGLAARTRGGQAVLTRAGRPGRATARVAAAPKAERELRRAQNAHRKLEADENASGLSRKRAARRVQLAENEVRRTQRRNLRVSGGEKGVRAQRTSRNLFVAGAQRGMDLRRGARFDRKLRRAGAEIIPRSGGEVRPRPGVLRKDIGKLPGIRPDFDEVVGKGFRDMPGVRQLTGRIARDIGEVQSVVRLRMLSYINSGDARIQPILKKLDKFETQALKDMVQLGITPDPKTAIPLLQKRLEQIEKARAGDAADPAELERMAQSYEERAAAQESSGRFAFGRGNATTLRRQAQEMRDQARSIRDGESGFRLEPGMKDEAARIQRILDDPMRHLTQDVRQAATRLVEIQRVDEDRDPALASDVAENRRLKPQAALLGVPLREPTGAEGVIRQYIKATEEQLDNRQPGTEAYDSARSRLDSLYDELDKHTLQGEGELLHEAAEGLERAGQPQAAADLRQRAEQIKAERPDEANVRGAAQGLRRMAYQIRQQNLPGQPERHIRRAATAMDRIAEKLRKGEDIDEPKRLEADANFAERVRKAAREAGLEEPGFWMSVGELRGGARMRATGRGFRGTERLKQYKGELHRLGIEDESPDVFVRGWERTVKRRFQWSLVVRNLDTHSFEWSKGPNGAGLTLNELRREMQARAIDPDTVDFIDATVFEQKLPDEIGGDMDIEDSEAIIAQDRILLNQAKQAVKTVEQKGMAGSPMFRFRAVPKEVTETTDALSKAFDSKVVRAISILVKEKPARYMLGLFNVPWLGFQVASNGIMTGLAGGLHPLNVWRAWQFDRRLRATDPDAHAEWEATAGITHNHSQWQEQTHLGDTNNRLVNFWRAYKQTAVGSRGPLRSPLDAMFRLDETQNNFWRRTLFYDRARKNAYKNMDRSWKGFDKSAERVIDRLTARMPEQQFRNMIDAGPDLEEAAKHVDDFLGNYLKFSSHERLLLSRHIVFYGWLRNSLRFTFYTMPIGHPVMANILANMGQLGAQEIKELMGVPDNYDLPVSTLIKMYTGKGEDLREIPGPARMSPFLNTLTQAQDISQVAGLVGPVYQAFAEQFVKESLFTGKDWTILGEKKQDTEKPSNYYGSAWSLLNPAAYSIPGVTEGEPRNRILQRNLLETTFPYRALKKTGLPAGFPGDRGEPGLRPMPTSSSDDTLMWDQRPITYSKRGDSYKPVREQREAQLEQPFSERLRNQLAPVFSEPSIQRGLVQEERRKRINAQRKREGKKPLGDKKRKKKAPKTNYGGSSSGGGNYGGYSSYKDRYGG